MQQIGRFKVIKSLGRGGQGEVFLCLDPQLQRQVAIKLLNRPIEEGTNTTKHFLQEARAISRIQHSNIVSIFDAGQIRNRPYLVFEYIDGQLLSDWIKGDFGGIAEALGIFTEVLRGVAEMHLKGMIHRDLKPANIILSVDLSPKIMDFGLAKIIDVKSSGVTKRAGTPRYMAPEYITEGAYSPQSDVFALGEIFYELLTGRQAFEAKSQKALLQKILDGKTTSPSEYNSDIDLRLEAIVNRALQSDPADRYENAKMMLDAVIEYQADSQSKSSGSDQQTQELPGTASFLIRRMQHTSDFPALSESIRTLNKLTNSEEQDVGQLASVLIRDFALSTRILRVVNSAYYSRFAGKVGTISRAIVVLGINTIRTIAASLIFFEHLHNKTHTVLLKDRIVSSIFAAALARQAALDAQMEQEEEGFLCGMLHTLGQILVVYYLHSENEEILRLVKQENIDREQAERRVLGVSCQELGTEIARQWNFPDTIVHGMTSVDPAKPGNLKQQNVKLRLIANFSNEAADMIGNLEGENDRAPIKQLLKRYRMGLAISEKRFTGMVKEARKEFKYLSSLGSSHRSRFMRRLTDQTIGEKEKSPEPTHDEDLAQTLGLDVFADAVFDAAEERVEPEQTPEMILTEGLQEVSAMLLDERANLNQIVNVVLETVYRAMSFDRVLLCLSEPVSKSYAARLGFGKDIEPFIEVFRFSKIYNPDVFHAALKNGADIYVSDTRNPKIIRDIPEWYSAISTAEAFAVFPLVVKESPVGLIYADYSKAQGGRLVGKSLNLIKALRNQIILALR